MSLPEEKNAETLQFKLKVKNISLHIKRKIERKSDISSLRVSTWHDVLNREYEEWVE